MISLDINPNILSKLQKDLEAKKEIAKLLKRELVKYSKKIWKKGRIKIEKDLLQCLLPTLLELITEKEEILKYLDLSEVSFDNIRVACKNFKDSNANIDPQTVKDQTLYKTNLQNCNMTGKDFTDVMIESANLKNTNAQIDPQLVYAKNLQGTNLYGCNMAGKDFTDVDIHFANLKNTGAQIDPQLVYAKNLQGTNLYGCNMAGKDFTDVVIDEANLENTNAQIDPQLIRRKSLYHTNVKGCTFINQSSPDSIKREPADFTDVDIRYANLEDTNAQIDPQLIEDKSLIDTNLKGLDLSHANFYGVNIWGANLEGTGAIIDPHTVQEKRIYGTNLNYCTLIDDGKLDGVIYNPYDSFKYVTFLANSPLSTENIYQDITKYIQKKCKPSTDITEKITKVFKKKKG